jgi:hypothetical protein
MFFNEVMKKDSSIKAIKWTWELDQKLVNMQLKDIL